MLGRLGIDSILSNVQHSETGLILNDVWNVLVYPLCILDICPLHPNARIYGTRQSFGPRLATQG